MFSFLCKKLIQTSSKNLQNPSTKSISHFTKSTNQPSFTVDYLINSCGLSPESALSAAKGFHLRTTNGPNSVLEFLKNHGFTQTQIAQLISIRPRFLTANVDRILRPRIKAFQDLGLSDSKLAELIATNPYILIKRLNSPITPFLEFLRSLVQTDENIIKVLKRSRWLISCDIERRMKPNIALLQDYGVPISRISYLIMTQPGILMQKPDTLRKIIDNVKKLGFACGSGMFTLAIHVMSSMSKSTWDSKIELLKSLGWSEKEILDAFNRMPLYMTCSEKKIRSGMDFFVNKLKWKPSVISRHPKLLMHSLKEKVIPRTTVWRILMSKDLISEEKELIYMLNLTEDTFFEKYVTKYEEEVPYLFKACKGELEFGWLETPRSI